MDRELELTSLDNRSYAPLSFADPYHLPVSGRVTNPIQIIRYLADKNGVDYKLALRIADAESKFICDAKNPNSSALGLFQFLKATWIHKRTQYGLDSNLELRKDCWENTLTAMLTIADGEISRWNESSDNWK